jgi:hypothetical protein
MTENSNRLGSAYVMVADEKIAQLARRQPDALALQQHRDEDHPSATCRNDESPHNGRHAGLGGDLAEGQRQAEQAAGDGEQGEGRIPERVHRGWLNGPDGQRQRQAGEAECSR